MPPVRGRRRVRVAATFVGSSVSGGALAGFVAGAAWLVARMPALGPRALAAVGVAAVALDAAYVLTGRLRPPCVRKQVPREWGRLLGGNVAAALYGVRLGAGPLTILVTWVWWASLVAGVSAGPGWSAVAGASFGALRAAAILGASAGAGPARSAVLAGAERRAWAALAACVLAASALAAT